MTIEVGFESRRTGKLFIRRRERRYSTGMIAAVVSLLPIQLNAAAPQVTVAAKSIAKLSAHEGWLYPGILRSGRLVLPDTRNGDWGIAFVSLKGASSPRVEFLRFGGKTYNPLRAGFGHATWWVWTQERRWLILDDELGLRTSIDGRFATPVPPPVVLGDRAVVYGTAGPEVTGSGYAYLFELTSDGDCVPILEFSSSVDLPQLVRETQWIGVAGGLGRSPTGSFAFTDPRSFKIFVFDHNATLQRVFEGANRRWHPPNWSTAVLESDDPSGEDWWRWALAQVSPRAPVFLDENHIAVLVGYPTPGRLGQSLELDVYRSDGTAVASGVPVPGIEGVSRFHVVQRTSPEPGDDIVIWLDREFPPPLVSRSRPPEVWSITVSLDEIEEVKSISLEKSE